MPELLFFRKSRTWKTRVTVLCHDDVRMPASVSVDVVHGFLEATDYLYGARKAAVLRLEGLRTRWSKRQLFSKSWA
jgi:hypothetical protein